MKQSLWEPISYKVDVLDFLIEFQNTLLWVVSAFGITYYRDQENRNCLDENAYNK
jgi:hypothetical protein